MKKAISVILVFALSIGLCACGGSPEANAVDDLILSIGKITIDSAEAVENAFAAYSVLSDKDKEKVKNYSVLQEAKEELFQVELYTLSNRIIEMHGYCQHVAGNTEIIWNNVGTSNFWTHYNSVCMFNIDMSKSEYDKLIGKNVFASLWAAAAGICPSQVSESGNMTSEAMEYTIALCVDFNTSRYYIEDNMSTLSDDVRKFRDKYEDDYKDETDTLNEWCIECSMYADFALNPSGSLASYTESDRSYNESMSRYEKIMDAYY